MRTRMFSQSVSTVALAAGIAIAGSTPLHAVIVDLVTNTSGTANGGFFTRTDNHSTGTGVIDPFVRLSSNDDVIDGYNASARPVMPDVNTSPTFTRDIRLNQIPIVVNPSGQTGSFYEFLLDINQTRVSPILSLHEIEIYTRSTPLATANTYAALTGSATKRWDLDVGTDGDSRIQLDYTLNEGSGSGDMFAYIPVSAFALASTSDYLYFYSAFGIPDPNNDGFEEWAVRIPASDVPGVPDGGTTAILLGSVLLGVAFIQRRLFC